MVINGSCLSSQINTASAPTSSAFCTFSVNRHSALQNKTRVPGALLTLSQDTI